LLRRSQESRDTIVSQCSSLILMDSNYALQLTEDQYFANVMTCRQLRIFLELTITLGVYHRGKFIDETFIVSWIFYTTVYNCMHSFMLYYDIL